MVTSHARGHKIVHQDGAWIYVDTKQPLSVYRACARCGKYPTHHGHDACLGKIPGVLGACCGHGRKEDSYKWFTKWGLDDKSETGYQIQRKDVM